MPAGHSVKPSAQEILHSGGGVAVSGFGARVKQARLELAVRRGEEVSQSALARLMGVEPSTVQRWEAGTKMPTLETVEQLAEVLGASPAFLAFGIITAPLKEVPPGTPNAVPISRELPPPQVPAKEVSRHKKAPLHRPTRDADEGKGRKKA